MTCHFCQIQVNKMSYKLDIRKGIYQLVGRVPKRDIVRIYRDQNISVSTIYQTIKECQEGIPCINLPKSGRPKVLSRANEQRLVERAKNKVGTSVRKLSRRFHISRSTVSRILSRYDLNYRKRRKAPKYTAAQLERIPRCCRALRRTHFREKVIVMDDEKYFTLSNSEIKGNDGFYTDNVQNVPDTKLNSKAKSSLRTKSWYGVPYQRLVFHNRMLDVFAVKLSMQTFTSEDVSQNFKIF